jgi:hypothetical protein
MCDVCGDAFFTAHDLKMHKDSHNAVKSFPCSVCSFSSSSKRSLQCMSIAFSYFPDNFFIYILQRTRFLLMASSWLAQIFCNATSVRSLVWRRTSCETICSATEERQTCRVRIVANSS